MVTYDENGEEELLGTGTFAKMQELRDFILEQFENNWDWYGAEALTPVRIQPFTGW